MRYTELIERLLSTAKERVQAKADENDRYMNVVARISREDGALFSEAAAAIRELEARWPHDQEIMERAAADRIREQKDIATGLETALLKIVMRTNTSPDDTDEDRKRDLRHIKSIARSALSKIGAS